jgi:hypothetical protein
MTLKLAHKLELPNDAVTQTFLILGKRGSGKTNTAVVLAEEMIKLAPIVVLDPIDAWWGLKSSFEGDRPGLNIYVFGGRHPDLPLDPHTGELMARLFIEHRISMILSMKGWSVADRARFVTDFVTYLLNHNDRVPVHIFLEEADAFIPQRPQPDEAKMLGATDRLIRWGRMDGIGATAISQRSAAINKNTTTQAETLIAHRTIGPQDRDAIEEWIKFHGTKEDRDKILSELPHLKNGEAYVWSPEWLKLLERVFMRRRHTFDSAATPKVGEKMITPKTLSSVDLQKISGQLQSVIDHANQDDPKLLRTALAKAQLRVEELQRMLAALESAPPKIEMQTTVIEPDWDELQQLWNKFYTDMKGKTTLKLNFLAETQTVSGPPVAQDPQLVPSRTVREIRDPLSNAVRQAQNLMMGNRSEFTLPQQRIIDALAWMESIGQRGSHWTIVAMLAQQKPKSSGLTNNVSVLRAGGLLEGSKSTGLTLTDKGRKLAVTPSVPLTTRDVVDAITAKITTPQARILKYLVSSGSPSLAPWATVANHTNQSPTSSGFVNNVSVLRSMGLIKGNRTNGLMAEDVVFLNGQH